MDERRPPAARRVSSQDASRPTDRLALGSALLGGLLVAAVLGARVILSGSEPRPARAVLGGSVTEQPTRVQAGSQPTAASSVPAGPRAPAAPSAPASGTASDRAHVAHTEGQGVVLRASPRDDDWTPRGFMDGDAVTVLERRGADWARVRGDNGQEGWVPARYLRP